MVSNIKVLKDNSKNIEVKKENIKIFPLKIKCSECDSELEITEEDTHIGWMGARFINCPCCGEEAMVDELEGITLTVDNIEFPIHFHHVSVETGAKERCNTEEIRYELRRAITYFRENKEETDWHTWSGNLFVFVRRWSGDENYEVVVSKDFYNIEIDFDENDNKSTRLRDAVDGLIDAIDGFGNMI